MGSAKSNGNAYTIMHNYTSIIIVNCEVKLAIDIGLSETQNQL